jgi:F420 biosynthesis protein FbiB-like protein
MNGETFLDLLSQRRSMRSFTPQPIARAVLERLMQAAVTAPSPTNRQPWRFALVTKTSLRQSITEAVRLRAEEMKAIIRKGHHAEDFGQYGDFFHEPLSTAAAIIVPQYRIYPDLIANLVASGGGDPSKFHTAASMQAELCSTSAACMALLLQAQAEGLGACWMSGPMIARDEIQGLLDIREPWRMVGAMALGYPDQLPTKQPRKPLAQVVSWFEDEP